MTTQKQLQEAFQRILGPDFGKTARKTGRKRRQSKGPAKNEAEISARAAASAKATEDLFKSKGYSDCRAHETILTYDKWLKKGRVVRRGEKSLQVKRPDGGYGAPLFHFSQTEPAQQEAAPSTQTIN